MEANHCCVARQKERERQMEINPCCMKRQKGGREPHRNLMEILEMQPETKTLTLKKVDVPTPEREDDIIIKVAFAGVCGTDLNILEGVFPASDQPLIMGHEISGTVHAIGSDVKHVKIGDNVGVDPNSSCSVCKYCRTGAYHMCPDLFKSAVGIFRNGGWAQYCKVPGRQVYKLPCSITLSQGVLLEPLSCISHAMSRINPVPVGHMILVLGAGIAGNLMSSMLHHSGHRNVVVAEPHDGRQNLVRGLFPDSGYQVIFPHEVKEVFEESGIDLCIDCSGNGEAIENSLDLMNPGGKICIYGVADPETKIRISPFEIFLKELSIFGTTVNRFTYHQAIHMMEAMGSRYIDFEKLGIKVFPICQYEEALDNLRNGLISKAVFQLDPEAK